MSLTGNDYSKGRLRLIGGRNEMVGLQDLNLARSDSIEPPSRHTLSVTIPEYDLGTYDSTVEDFRKGVAQPEGTMSNSVNIEKLDRG